jgi:hypothetical protein
MQAQRRAARGPVGRRAIVAAVEGDHQAFVAAPRIAQSEQGERIEEGVDRGLRYGLEDDAEQPRGAGEVAAPNGVSGVVLECRMQNS